MLNKLIYLEVVLNKLIYLEAMLNQLIYLEVVLNQLMTLLRSECFFCTLDRFLIIDPKTFKGVERSLLRSLGGGGLNYICLYICLSGQVVLYLFVFSSDISLLCFREAVGISPIPCINRLINTRPDTSLYTGSCRHKPYPLH